MTRYAVTTYEAWSRMFYVEAEDEETAVSQVNEKYAARSVELPDATYIGLVSEPSVEDLTMADVLSECLATIVSLAMANGGTQLGDDLAALLERVATKLPESVNLSLNELDNLYDG